MTIPVVIVGIVVLSVTITVCTVILLGFCLWPVIQELQEAKRLKERQNKQANSSGFLNVR
ncbi:unnamed protein product, partial [Rotaria socialis]